MATSGRMQGNTVDYSNYVFIDWQLAGQDIAGNYSTINWQMYWHFQNNDRQLDNGYANVGDATRWSNGGRVYNYTGNFSTRDLGIASGSFNIGHNSDGTKTLNVAGGLTGYSGQRSEGSASWALPTIPRHASITNASGNTNDELTAPWVEFSNPAGTPVDAKLELFGTGVTGLNPITGTQTGSGIGSRYTWAINDTTRNAIRAAMANVNTATLRHTIHDSLGGDSYSYIDRTISIINANPTFADFTYSDTNSATAAVTGNNQILIQGKSTIGVVVSTANKMTPLKSATGNNYTAAFDGTTDTQPFSSSASVNLSLGTPANSGSKTLSVTARDSRSNTTAVSKTVTVLPYASPVVNLSAARVNNFENTTNISISGVIALLTLSGVNKNSVNTASGIAYRYREAGGTWSAWTNRTSATNSTTGNVTTTAFTLNLDNSKQYEIEARIIDALETQSIVVTVPAGIGAFRIGKDKRVYNNEQPLMPSHVGLIIHSTTLATAAAVAAIYGGTWVAWGTGRVLVGMGSNGTNNYTTVEATGGADAVTLTTSQMPTHNHQMLSEFGTTSNLNVGVPGDYNQIKASGGYGGNYTQNAGSGSSHENRQSYITAYMWKRTA